MTYGLGNASGGMLGGIDPGVKLLQDELGKLSAATGNADISPGRNDGTMTLGTIIALSHAAGALGTGVNPALGQAVDVVNLIKSPLSKIPYAGQVIDIVLSPWIIDNVFDTILALMHLIPGAGDAANATSKAVDAFKLVLASVSSSLAGALALARQAGVKPPGGLGDAHAWWQGATRSGPDFYDPRRHGPLFGDADPPTTAVYMTQTQLPIANWTLAPAASTARPTIQVGGGSNTCGTGQYRNSAGQCVAIPTCPAGQRFVVATQSCQKVEVHEHSAWPPGKAIVGSQWSKTLQFRGKLAVADLAPTDQNAFKHMALYYAMQYSPGTPIGAQLQKYLNTGVAAFMTFTGSDGTSMGAFMNAIKGELAIVPLPPKPKKKGRKSLWGQFVDAVDDTVDYASDAIGDAANAVGDLLSDLWDAIGEQAVLVYETVKKYGCALVGSDIVVALAATGAGIVASPAASAAVVSGAAAGRTGCAILEVGELVIAILRLLSTDFPPPPALAPTGIMSMPVNRILGVRTPPSGQLILGSPLPTYPTGSIARFNLDKGVWTIYAPITAFGATAAPDTADVLPPPPEGFIKVAESIAQPPGTQAAGDERKRQWYDSKLVWGGAALTFLGGVMFVRHRRRSK